MNQRGAAAVEFAMIGPILLLLLAGLIDYGLYIAQSMRTGSVVQTALQYGAHGNVSADEVRAFLIRKLVEAGVEGADVGVERRTGCPEGIVLADNRCPGYGAPQTHLIVSAAVPFATKFMPTLGPIERRMSARLR